MFPLAPSMYIEIAAFITSLVFWKKIKASRLRWLTLFLSLIVLVEFVGRYIRTVLHQPNSWLYNISVPIEYLFYAFLFQSFYKKKVFKEVVRIFLFCFPIWCVFNILSVQGFFNFNTNFLKLGSFCMIVLSFFIFIEMLTTEDMVNPFLQPLFWIASGVFLFNAGEFTYDMFMDFMVKEWRINEMLFIQINSHLIFVLYSSICISTISTT
jgi:hypothetical protein